MVIWIQFRARITSYYPISFLYFQCFAEKLFELSFCKQFLYCNKHKDGSSTAMIYLRWKKFAQIIIRGYSYYMVLTITFQLVLC